MDIIEAIRLRKSIRGYKPDPVPKHILKEILDIATWSPSGTNTQAWEFTVVTGEVLDQIKQGNAEMLASKAAPNPDVPYSEVEGVHRQRQVGVAVQLYQLMGIAREDKKKRAEWSELGIRFFNAPAAIILSADCALGEARTQFDIGLITQTICLAALNYGLGTCIQRQSIRFPEVVRKFTDIPKSKRITISIAIGYPDWDFPANRVESKREPVDNITAWYGFD